MSDLLEPGIFIVEFVNGDVRELDVDHSIVDMMGHVLMIVTTDDTRYNFSNVISYRKKD